MNGKSIRISLALVVAMVGFSAFGCGGIPMPEKAKDYKTWVQRGSVPDDVVKVDVIHADFTIEFEKEGGVTEEDLLDLLKKCSANGSCGTMARLIEDGKYLNENLSCSCEFTNIDDVDDKFKIETKCLVPVIGGLNFDKQYKLKLTTVSLNESDKPDLAFTSSPEFIVKYNKFVSVDIVKLQSQ